VATILLNSHPTLLTTEEGDASSSAFREERRMRKHSDKVIHSHAARSASLKRGVIPALIPRRAKSGDMKARKVAAMLHRRSAMRQS
jgi:hypothetical protein